MLTVHLHIVNSLYVVCDLLLSAVPIRLYHVTYTVLYGAAYTWFVIVYKMAGGTAAHDQTFIYWILDWDRPVRASFFSLLGLASVVPVHLLIFTVYKWRDAMARWTDDVPYDEIPLLER